MNKKILFKIRLYFTGVVTFLIWTFLLWDHYHDGVPRHHILANKDLPAISNWWGGILLPFLTWFLLYRIQNRIISQGKKIPETSKYLKYTLYRFAASLLFGISLSTFFTFGYADFSGYLVVGLFPLALFIPIYRAECLLGFVIGMTITFGTILPMVIGSIFVLLGAFVYLVLRPGILYISSRVRPTTSSNN